MRGISYDPFDPELVALRVRARDLCQALNASRESEQDERRRLLIALFGSGGGDAWIQPPFYCDYGGNISLGTRVFFNFNCVVLDVCPVRIGDYTLCGPSVQIYTAMHPLDPIERRAANSDAGRDRFGRLDRRGRRHLSRRHDWLPLDHRRRQRGDARRPAGRVRRWQPVSRDQGARSSDRR